MTLAVGACGFEPIYGDGGLGSETTAVDQRFATLEVAPANGRVGQKLRNELLFRMGRGSNPTNSVNASQTLFLRVSARTSDVSISSESGRPEASVVTVTASYHIVAEGEPVPAFQVVEQSDVPQSALNDEDDDPNSADTLLQARVEASGTNTIYQGRRFRQASFDWIDQRFANDRAEIDAQNRAAIELAQDIYLELAAFYARQG
ncbi:MAG: LPS assembly lipoprotein LptE [Pseudomonadota bacterium]